MPLPLPPQDTVDILLGQHIDLSLACWVVQLASRSLRELKMFWAAGGDFGSLLTGQLFIEVMES